MSMGVYIKGMEMPTDRSRWVVIYPDGKVEYSDKTDEWETLDKGAVPVPPHGRLGDLDNLADNMRSATAGMEHRAIIMHEIRRAPTIIPASEEGE